MPAKRILVVAFAIGAWSVLATARESDQLPALETKVERLQSHLESIESVRAIKRLQYAYGHYVEFGLWNDFADLFAADDCHYQGRGPTLLGGPFDSYRTIRKAGGFVRMEANPVLNQIVHRAILGDRVNRAMHNRAVGALSVLL